jgi:hypothetical protein
VDRQRPAERSARTGGRGIQYAEKSRELAEATGRMWLETQLYIHKPQRAIRGRSHHELTARYRAGGESLGQPVWGGGSAGMRRIRRPPEQWWAIDLWGSWGLEDPAVTFVVIYLPPRLPSYKVGRRR